MKKIDYSEEMDELELCNAKFKKVLQALTGEKVSKDPRISLKDRCRVNKEKKVDGTKNRNLL